jgi:Mg/Co/Ni transporter MgtE
VRLMPAHLIQAMPVLVLGLVAMAVIVVRGLVPRLTGGGQAFGLARRDLWTGLAVAASWFAIWGLYAAYYWTNDPGEDTLQTVRFYVPAIGAISLLGAWLLTRIPGRGRLVGATSAAVVTVLFAAGTWSFHVMIAPPPGP